ncbi:MAG TPA: DUF6220 domain-containing protein [Bacillales bacterium]|nr:DUF6220 domain-containing protein [Bacillales bacterium]
MEPKNVSGGVRFSRYAYVTLAMIFAACVMAQVFLAGMAIFGNPADWKMHAAFVSYFQYLPILIFVLAFTGRIKGELRWMPLGLIVLLVVQYATANMANLASGYIAAIHPVTGMGMFVLAMNIVRASWSSLLKASRKNESYGKGI